MKTHFTIHRFSAEDEMEITETMQRRKQEDNDEDVAKLESTVAQTKNELLNLQVMREFYS